MVFGRSKRTGDKENDGDATPRSHGNADLMSAIAAASAASSGPDLDAIVEEMIAKEKAATPPVDIERLAVVRPIGMGGQGGVWLAADTGTNLRCAVKQIKKGRLSVLPKKAATRALLEREALADLGDHPFITTCYATFQNDSSLFFALELAPGGDLFSLLDHYPTGLPESHARFYSACVALALRHVHANGYVYRDVKLENVLISADGYGKICDFGFAKKASTNRTFTKCGTDEYAPPEVVSGRGRNAAADWWALGILLHEMLTGRPPFEGGSAEDVFNAIRHYSKGGEKASEQLQSSVRKAADSLTADGAQFLSGLLQVRESERIGAGPAGFVQIQLHAWFEPLDWEGVLSKEVQAPWVPPVKTDGHSGAFPDIEFANEEVMAERPYDHEVWDPIFAEFGPYRQRQWP